MLHEEKFNVQERVNGKFKRLNSPGATTLSIDPITGKIIPGEFKPSAAEILLYLITGKLNEEVLPMQNRQVIEELANLFIHYQSDTNNNKVLLKNKPRV
ncbi:hypothetical protein [Sharpea azabuensis]|uniref:hypothetical protein n=1 Tax=Sharpea azabuensis TaxID=322505 RepID=UPI0015691285|nr:hypothetical protein [Sharpea azabuensis]